MGSDTGTEGIGVGKLLVGDKGFCFERLCRELCAADCLHSHLFLFAAMFTGGPSKVIQHI